MSRMILVLMALFALSYAQSEQHYPRTTELNHDVRKHELQSVNPNNRYFSDVGEAREHYGSNNATVWIFVAVVIGCFAVGVVLGTLIANASKCQAPIPATVPADQNPDPNRALADPRPSTCDSTCPINDSQLGSETMCEGDSVAVEMDVVAQMAPSPASLPSPG
eukprot:TRINITY_DN253_c0_g1_i1.p1 TRINITY_DN253_c0_g1~~TRINITY_DN253_c0_g1_i1.p1  ORF type:complete len:164 (+),score=6.14 TRINITY_DN253_c0_g1_i1:126-617(+)